MRPLAYGKKRMMSMFGKLFTRKRGNEELSAEDAIHKLKDTEEILVKKQEYYEMKIEEEIATARKHGKKNQRMALNALRRKKHHEVELSRIDGVLAKLEAQRSALEDAGTHVEVMKVLDDANKSLKKANLNMDVDKVHDLMDDISEQLADSEEFANAIGQPIGDVASDDDLLNELKELEEAAAADTEMEDVPTSLPEVPTGPITRSMSREHHRPRVQKQDTMAELEAWAAAN